MKELKPAKEFIKKWFYDIDKFTLFFALSLMLLGFITSLTIGPAMAHRIGRNISDYYLTIHQIVFYVIAIFAMLFCSMLSRRSILNFSYIGYMFCFFLLLFVLVAGHSIKGSRRWINLGFFAIQPSEVMKPFFIIVNAHFLSISKYNNFLPVVSIASFAMLMLMFILQPDFGSVIIYSIIWFVQIFLSDINLKFLLYTFMPAAIFVCIVGFLFFPHIHYRVINFFTLRGGQEQYQTKKAIESIYNGGFFGKGLGEGVVKYQLPDAHTDYIFSVICEEFGIVFSICLILYFLLFIYRHLVSNIFSKKYEIRIVYGIVMFFMMQSCIHMSVNTNLFPSKGMTLPFVSYGGSSILSNSIMFGFLLAFTRKEYNYRSPYRFFENVYCKK